MWASSSSIHSNDANLYFIMNSCVCVCVYKPRCLRLFVCARLCTQAIFKYKHIKAGAVYEEYSCCWCNIDAAARTVQLNVMPWNFFNTPSERCYICHTIIPDQQQQQHHGYLFSSSSREFLPTLIGTYREYMVNCTHIHAILNINKSRKEINSKKKLL